MIKKMFCLIMMSGFIKSASASEFPLERVVLFNSGVGFFERQAEMDGRQTVNLSFETELVSDVIKSLVVLDKGGGAIQAVTYDARDPVERTLRAFSLDISDNPTLGLLLNRARGVPVRVQSGAQSYEGAIIGVESRTRVIGEPPALVELEYLNLLSADGIRSLPLDTLQGLQILDKAVAKDLSDALEVLAGSVARDRRGIRLVFDGKGRRSVSVGYLLESPVWKTSYRLVLDEKGGFLQGWAHVENMTDEDWENVELSLVSGRPVSFIQNLYDPIYLSRPVVEMELAAIAPPPVYNGMLEDAEFSVGAVGKERLKTMAAPRPMESARMVQSLAFDRSAVGGAVNILPGAEEVGELFRYPGGRVSLSRRSSAMIPIVNSSVSAASLSIFNESVNAKHPLNGVALTNDTGLFLMQGPVTVFAAGEYAGDARLGDTPRNEQKLLSYALDLQSEVKVDRASKPEEIVSIRIVRGVLDVSRRFVQEAVYRVRNKRDSARTVLIQHPHRADWSLMSPSDGVERARDEYRIRVEIDPESTADLTVREERIAQQTVSLSSISGDQVVFYLRQQKISQALRAALTQIAELQREQAQARAEREQLERKRQDITQEQARIRDNMRTVSRPSESFTMWERKLVEQESEITKVNHEIERLRTVEREKQKEIENYIADLNVE